MQSWHIIYKHKDQECEEIVPFATNLNELLADIIAKGWRITSVTLD